MRIAKIAMSIAIMSAILAACSQTPKKTEKKPFTLPEIPEMFTTPEARANFLVVNYWNNYDFSDTSLVNKPEISEQLFVDFLQIAAISSPADYREGVDSLLTRAMRGDSLVFAHTTELAEKYLHEPNSPAMNEEMFIPFLEFIVRSPKVSKLDKTRPEYQLEIARKNRVGQAASDFEYITAAGAKGSLYALRSHYTIIYFNNPGCGECKRTSEFATSSEVFNSLIASGKLTILAVYPDSDLEAWKEEKHYGSNWINSRIADSEFKQNDVYDLKAIPCIYLLDKDKTVILKDATIQNVNWWLEQNALQAK